MKFTTLAALGLVFVQSAFAATATDATYDFPVKNRFAATLLTGAYHAGVPYKRITVEPRAERSNVALYQRRNKIDVGLFLQKKRAPLAFVIAGVGGGALSGSTLVLGSMLYAMGYSAVTLPNPIFWQYALGESESALPGFLPRDVKEYYSFLQDVVSELKANQKIDISGYSVLGSSYGALVTGFLMEEDASRKIFNFDRAVLINPAIDVAYDIDVLDSLYAAGDRVSPNRKGYLQGLIMNVGADLLNEDLTPESVGAVASKLRVTDDEMAYLIGDSFRSNLSDVILVSQQVHDLGILKQPATDYQRTARAVEAKSFSFHDYLTQFVVPSIQKERNISFEEISKQGNLYALADRIRTDKRIFVMENADDFLLKDGDLTFLANTAGERFYLYPYGGHLGNLWMAQNQRDLGKIMTGN